MDLILNENCHFLNRPNKQQSKTANKYRLSHRKTERKDQIYQSQIIQVVMKMMLGQKLMRIKTNNGKI